MYKYINNKLQIKQYITMNFKIYILFILSMFAVSSSPLIARHLIHIDSISISFWRMLIASLILIFFDYYKNNNIFISREPKLILAGSLLGIHFCLFYTAISVMPNNIVNATVFGTMAPLFALLIEVYQGKKINKKLIIGLLIVLFGSIIMFIYDFSFDSNLTYGNFLAILCSIAFGFVFILSEQIRIKESSISFSKNIFIYASITILIIGLTTQTSLLINNLNDFIFLIILGLIPTIVGHSVLYYLVKYIRPSIVASIPLGEPFIASVFAWFLFPGQILNSYTITGGIITLMGLFIIIQSKK